MSNLEIHRLDAGGLVLEVAPALGGRMLSLVAPGPHGAGDILAPVPRDLPIHQAIRNAGSYPLVPYSNRIALGRFDWGGQPRSVPIHPLGAPHAIHGVGWVAAWSVVEAEADRLVIALEHEGEGWPWRFRAEQHFALSPHGLTVSLEVENRSDEPMPCGLGFHPYFPRPAGLRLATAVREHWCAGDDRLPFAVEPADGRFDPQVPQPFPVGLDDGFSGWSREAVLDYGTHRVRLHASAGLDHLVIYSPEAGDYCCVEPVSHRTNAAHAADPAAQGWLALAPGARRREWMSISLLP